MKHFVSLSGGTASAVAADRVIKRYGKDNVTLWFADTSWEHESLYTFLDDLEAYWEMEIVRYKDGRNPLEVASDRSIIPNQKIAPCSMVLKVEPARAFIEAMEKPVTVHLGFDWAETHRAKSPRDAYESIDGVSFDMPLLWGIKELVIEGFERTNWEVEGFDSIHGPYSVFTESWGLETPSLYTAGFSHNNCGGSCVKQGKVGWIREFFFDRERFEYAKNWEIEQRAKGGPRANYAMVRDARSGTVKPLPLYELEKKYCQGQQLIMEDEDEIPIACYCPVI